VIPSECCPIDSSRPNPDKAPAPTNLEPTFRDPAGQLLLQEDCALRRVRPAAVEEALLFLRSPLCRQLERDGDLISSEILDASSVDSSIFDSSAMPPSAQGELWLRHPRIDPISYPWEWTPAQWRAAAELTLRVAGKAIDAGWMLKDATPLNVLFAGPRPVFIDVLSFEKRDPHSTVWLAYGQFVRTFLLPLVALKYLSWPLETTLFWRDGYEPAALYRALPRWRRFHPALLDVVTLASMFEGKSGKTSKPRPSPSASDPELAAHILHKRLTRLGKQIRSMAGEPGKSQWSRYEQSASHYQAADVEQKKQWVSAVLERSNPARVLDVGANTGTYSLLAAAAGAQVVALDSDSAALEALGRAALEKNAPITALVANIARPTPAAGWRNREHLSLLDRLTIQDRLTSQDRVSSQDRLTGQGQLAGRFDLVLLLAVIHHLILREQLPLAHIAELCATLTSRWLVVEWVPPSDPMFQEWLRGRDHLYGHLSEDDLLQAFAPFFRGPQQDIDRCRLANGRVLLLFERQSTIPAQSSPQISTGAPPA
jgi:SAM-dependent methyltransferase